MLQRHIVIPSDRIVGTDGQGDELGTLQLARHTFSVCFNRDSDGTRTRVRSAASRSRMNSAVSVLPVPQAMVNCPRCADANPLITFLIASRW